MVQVKLSVVFILAAAAIADVSALPFPMFHGEHASEDTDTGSGGLDMLATVANSVGYIPTPNRNIDPEL